MRDGVLTQDMWKQSREREANRSRLFYQLYLTGTVPFTAVIGKVFYRTDVRQHICHNIVAISVESGFACSVLFAPTEQYRAGYNKIILWKRVGRKT